MPEDEWPVYHRYNKLVRRGLAQPFKCTCGGEQQLMMGSRDEPKLKCYMCGALTSPGLDVYTKARAQVKEHFL